MSEQIFQIAVKALVQNKSGKIFMVHVPKWGDNPEHWDLPGGRMDPGETFLETLHRELKEEVGVGYIGKPKQLTGMLTNITIPVDGKQLPLVFMIYLVDVGAGLSKMKLVDDIQEDNSGWFTGAEAANLMATKFSPEFCDLVRKM